MDAIRLCNMDEKKCDKCGNWFTMNELIRTPGEGNNHTDFLCFSCYRNQNL